MAKRIKIHPITPHQKRIFEVADVLKNGGVVLFPTDSQYALGCDYRNKDGVERIRRIRSLGKDHFFTLLCESLSNTAKFANISNENFKVIKKLIPGPYTFILPATREVPRLLLNPKRKTIGFRVPDYPITSRIIADLGAPVLATTAKPNSLNDVEDIYLGREEVLTYFDKHVDLIVDDQQDLIKQQSTVVNMTGGDAELVRGGLGLERVEEVFAHFDKDLASV